MITRNETYDNEFHCFLFSRSKKDTKVLIEDTDDEAFS